MDFGHPYLTGIPLLEVFSISITKDYDSERRTELYGVVQVIDERGTKAALCNRERGDSESISPNETITLYGPPRCISALTGFTINLSLKDRNQDLEISNGKICWDLSCASLYDKLLTIRVPGNNGFATVHCAVFNVAVEVCVEIELIRKDQSDGSRDMPFGNECYGTIVAHYGQVFDSSSSYQQKYFRSTLFRRPVGNSLKLEPGKPIPLLKSVLAVPTHASLVIEADLFLRDSKVQILKGPTPELFPLRHYENFIEGDSYDAKVTVSWNFPDCDEDFC